MLRSVAVPRLSVVIPTTGRRDSLGRVLARLGTQRRRSGEFEILVVRDAAAQPAPGEQPGDAATGTRTVAAQRPGASAARNAGWRAARGEVVLFLDDDIAPSPNLVDEHLGWHARHPEPTTGVLGHVAWSPDIRVTPFMRWLERGIQFDYGSIPGIEAAWWHLYSCNVSIKRQLVERVGGFDEEAFPFGHEDLDLGRRLADHGLRLLYNPAARGEHLRSDSLDSFRARIPRIANSEAAFVARWPEAKPYFRDLFAEAAARRARGRAARLAPVVPEWVPWLGPRVWASADTRFRQALAPDYARAWTEAQSGAPSA